MISRKIAIDVLYAFIDNLIVDEELSDDLQEIANLIELEGQCGIDAFGMDDEDYATLVVAPLASINGVVQQSYIDHCKKCEKIIEKYKWK